MAFQNTPLKWLNAGTEPSEELKTTGFQGGQKPPAFVFNNFLNRTYKCIEELQNTVETVQEDVTGGASLLFKNKSVASSLWVADTTYTEFPFKADISCAGVTAEHIPNVVFNVTEAMSGNFAPVADTLSGYVRIYATEKPTTGITIPLIECKKVVTA